MPRDFGTRALAPQLSGQDVSRTWDEAPNQLTVNGLTKRIGKNLRMRNE